MKMQQLLVILLSTQAFGSEMAQSEVQDVDMACEYTIEQSTVDTEIGDKRDFPLSVRDAGTYKNDRFYPYAYDNSERSPKYPGISNRKRARISPKSLTLTEVISGSAGETTVTTTISRVSLTLQVEVNEDAFDPEMRDSFYLGSGICKVTPPQDTRF